MIRTVPHVRDAWGYFISHNRRLVETLVGRPNMAQMLRAILEGVDLYATERGIDPALIDFEAKLQRDGRIVIRLWPSED